MATVVEKIFSAKAERPVHADDLVTVPVDACMIQDVNGPTAIRQFQSIAETVRSPEHHLIALDHFSPCPSVATANAHAFLRSFAAEQGVALADVGCGICHQAMLESGKVRPGCIAVGTDSHSCMYGVVNAFGVGVGAADAAVVFASDQAWFKVPRTIRVEFTGTLPEKVSGKDIALDLLHRLSSMETDYCCLEFGGSAVSQISFDSRAAICNMAVEAGAKGAIMPLDEVTRAWLCERGIPCGEGVAPDADAAYAAVIEIDLGALRPLVAVPPEITQIVPASELGEVRIQQALIGSCANGRYEDFAIAAGILKGRHIADGVRLLLFPSSREVERRIRADGTLDALLDAGAVLMPAVCGPCAGIHCGLLGDGETAVSTTNRNLTGRMGSRSAKVYVSSPLVAAFSALNGFISDCEVSL